MCFVDRAFDSDACIMRIPEISWILSNVQYGQSLVYRLQHVVDKIADIKMSRIFKPCILTFLTMIAKS
jgi:hypothetical protein